MISRETKRSIRKEVMLSALLVTGGLAVTGISLIELSARHQQSLRREMAQVTQPVQVTPSIPSGKDGGTPAESMPGGTRPTTPSPEPARPDAEAQKAGATPALPPAPAEKMGEPLPERK
jgi:hypothetical protein